ncbi:MAG: AAA family ATPase, partial [Myxococcota bacterium]
VPAAPAPYDGTLRPGGMVAIVGEQGAGRTHALRALGEGLFVQCPSDRTQLWAVVAEAAGAEAVTADAVEAALKAKDVHAVYIDDAHRLIRPVIGGLRVFDAFVQEACETELAWAMSFNEPCWNYLRRARSERTVFDDVHELPRWSKDAVGELVEVQAQRAGILPSYDDLSSPRSRDYADIVEGRETAKRDYVQVLWDYTRGNPSLVQHFFRESLGMRDGRVYVHLFETPKAEALDALPGTMLFVLRAIAQLEDATAADVVACTDLPAADVADSLRIAVARGVLRSKNHRHRITPQWFRLVMTVLRRQHLLA